ERSEREGKRKREEGRQHGADRRDGSWRLSREHEPEIKADEVRVGQKKRDFGYRKQLNQREQNLKKCVGLRISSCAGRPSPGILTGRASRRPVRGANDSGFRGRY